VRSYYEAFWQDEPETPDHAPYAWARRRGLLLREVQPGDRVLDLGCGDGRFLTVLAQAGAHPTGAEIAEEAARRARAHTPGVAVELVEPDGSLPFAHGAFDLVWCSEVLEHVPDVALTLSEVRRVLAPHGRLLLTVPYHSRPQAALIALTRFERHFDPLGQHVRFFTARSLREALTVTGFAPVSIRREGGMLVALTRRA
jgi:2-polyprenyl-3-methyl-5-hydroxy-6-metoxy-1,4-benzoquinol methylase